VKQLVLGHSTLELTFGADTKQGNFSIILIQWHMWKQCTFLLQFRMSYQLRAKTIPDFFFMPGSHSETIFCWLHLTQFPTTKKVCVSKSEGFFFSIFFSFRIFQHCRHQAGHLHLTSPKRLFKVICKMWIGEQTRLNIWTVKNEGNLRVAFCSIMLTRRNIEPLCGYFPTKSKSRRPVLMKRWS